VTKIKWPRVLRDQDPNSTTVVAVIVELGVAVVCQMRALSEVLQRPIEVIQADGPSVTVGDQFIAPPLRLV